MDKEDKKSLEHYKKQKTKAERNGNLKGQADACSVIGEIYSRYERYDEAIEEHQQELLLCEAQNCCISIALANRKLGECYCKKQLFDKAVPLHKRYLSLARECGDKVEEQRALATIGATYLGQCECENTFKGRREAYKLAEESFIKGLEVTEGIQSSLKEVDYMDMKGRLYQNLGLLYDEMNKLEASSLYFQKALAINKKYNLLENLYLCQSSLVSVCQKHGKMEEAKKHVELCVETAKKMKARDSEAGALMLKAMILLQEKEFQLSRHLLKKAHKVGIPIQKERCEKCYKYVKILHQGTETLTGIPEEDYTNKIKLFDKMGDAAADLGLYKQAIYYYEELLQASIELNKDKKVLATVHVSLAETLRDDKQLERAITHYQHEIDCRSEQEQDQVCRSWLNIGAIQELHSESYTAPQESYVNAFNAAKQAKNRKLQVESLENLVALFKCHRNAKLLQKTQERLTHTLSKYHITDSELDEDSQEDETITNDDDDVSDMSELTESEDEEVPSNTSSLTTVKSGRTTRKKVIKRNIKGETPLHTACIDGKLQEVLKYINQGHPVNVRDHGGWTPLHEASNFGHLEIVKILIEHGAKVDDRGGAECKGLTPLMDAASNGMLEVVQILVDSGASVTAKDDKLMTALDHLTDYVEATKDEFNSSELAEYRNMMDILKDKMPFHKAPAKVNRSQKGGLIPEAEAETFSKTVETKQRSRNDVIYDALSDSDDDTKENRSNNSKRNPRKRSPSPLYNTESQMSDDELYAPHLKDLDQEHGGQVAYKNAMASIGSATQRASQVVKKSVHSSTSKSALVAEDEYLKDDWLIDDMKPSAKRRKMDTDGYSFTSGLKTSKQSCKTSSSVDLGTENRRKDSLNKPRVPAIISDSEMDYSDTDSVVIGVKYNSPSKSEVSDNVVSSPDRCSPLSPELRALPNLEDTNSNESTSHVSNIDLTKNGCDKLHVKKKINRQTKLTDFGSAVSKSVPSPSHNTAVGQNSFHVETVSSSAGEHSSTKVLKIKVQIGDKLLMVPIVDRDGTKTFAWLVEEVATRYLKMFGLKPSLTLGTKDGAHFSPDDLINLVLSEGDKIEGVLQGWDLPPMTEQYKTACKALKAVMYKNIETLMRSCQFGTGRLELMNLSLRSVRFQPIVRAIQHQNCLRELELKGNCLGDSSVDSLSRVFHTIPNLTHLGLACNNITKQGLRHISDAVLNEKETSLKGLTCLDVSYNPLFDECQQQLISVIKAIPSLTKLRIASCNLTSQFFQSERPVIAQALNDSKIQHIDISYNLLENIGVYFFLRCQNPTKILSLNLTATTSKNPTRLCEHLSEYASEDGCVLQKVELCKLNIDEDASEELMRFTEAAPRLTSLDLSSNYSLTCEVMRKVIKGACHANSQLEQLIVNDCRIKSLSIDLLDTLLEKLTMPCPLRDVQFTCDQLTTVDLDSIKYIWKEKWCDNGKVITTENSVKLSVV